MTVITETEPIKGGCLVTTGDGQHILLGLGDNNIEMDGWHGIWNYSEENGGLISIRGVQPVPMKPSIVKARKKPSKAKVRAGKRGKQ